MDEDFRDESSEEVAEGTEEESESVTEDASADDDQE